MKLGAKREINGVQIFISFFVHLCFYTRAFSCFAIGFYLNFCSFAEKVTFYKCEYMLSIVFIIVFVHLVFEIYKIRKALEEYLKK